jgi:hypothetical protein
MRRTPSIEPFTPSPNIQLHPTLQAALDSLDVQIEAELSRYRRQRRQPQTRPQRQVRPQDPTALGILNQSIQLPTLGSSLYETSAPASAQSGRRPEDRPSPNRSPDRPAPQGFAPMARPAAPASSAPNQSGVAVWSVPPSAPVPTPQPASQSGYSSAASAYGGLENSAAVPTFEPDPAELAAELAPSEIASYANQYDLSAYVPNSTLQRLMHQAGGASTAGGLSPQTAIAAPDETVEDYLASSEELLRSIAEESREQPTDREPNSMLDTLLTPLGVGSMLLLLLTSTTLGYVMMNPASVGLSGGSLINSGNNGAAPSSQPAPTAAQTMTAPTTWGAAANQAAPSPNLAADEFVDLGLDTLSTIPRAKGQRPKPASQPATAEPKPAAKAASTSEAAAPARSVEPPETVVMPTVVDSTSLPELPARPNPQPSMATVVVPVRPPISEPPPVVSTNVAPVSPEPIRIAPPPVQPAPVLPSQPAPGLAAAPSAEATSSRYYVVTDYSGDASLEAARTAIPDAYVRNLPNAGAKVQLGSFNDEAGAEGMRQQLQQQGIEAEVYHP